MGNVHNWNNLYFKKYHLLDDEPDLKTSEINVFFPLYGIYCQQCEG